MAIRQTVTEEEINLLDHESTVELILVQAIETLFKLQVYYDIEDLARILEKRLNLKTVSNEEAFRLLKKVLEKTKIQINIIGGHNYRVVLAPSSQQNSHN